MASCQLITMLIIMRIPQTSIHRGWYWTEGMKYRLRAVSQSVGDESGEHGCGRRGGLFWKLFI